MKFVSNHLGYQRSIASCSVVNDKIYPVSVLHGLAYYWQNILDHFRIQHPIHHFVEREGFNIGVFIAHLEGRHEADNYLLAGVEKILVDLGELLSQRG